MTRVKTGFLGFVFVFLFLNLSTLFAQRPGSGVSPIEINRLDPNNPNEVAVTRSRAATNDHLTVDVFSSLEPQGPWQYAVSLHDQNTTLSGSTLSISPKGFFLGVPRGSSRIQILNPNGLSYRRNTIYLGNLPAGVQVAASLLNSSAALNWSATSQVQLHIPNNLPDGIYDVLVLVKDGSSIVSSLVQVSISNTPARVVFQKFDPANPESTVTSGGFTAVNVDSKWFQVIGSAQEDLKELQYRKCRDRNCDPDNAADVAMPGGPADEEPEWKKCFITNRIYDGYDSEVNSSSVYVQQLGGRLATQNIPTQRAQIAVGTSSSPQPIAVVDSPVVPSHSPKLKELSLQCYDIKLSLGENNFEFHATDLRGLLVRHRFRINYHLPTVVPPVSDLNLSAFPLDSEGVIHIASDRLTVSGKTKPDSDVKAMLTVFGTSNVVKDYPGLVDRDGNFWIEGIQIPEQLSGDSPHQIVIRVGRDSGPHRDQSFQIRRSSTQIVNVTQEFIQPNPQSSAMFIRLRGEVSSADAEVFVNSQPAASSSSGAGAHTFAIEIPLQAQSAMNARFRINSPGHAVPSASTEMVLDLPERLFVSSYNAARVIENRTVYDCPGAVMDPEVKLIDMEHWVDGETDGGLGERTIARLEEIKQCKMSHYEGVQVPRWLAASNETWRFWTPAKEPSDDGFDCKTIYKPITGPNYEGGCNPLEKAFQIPTEYSDIPTFPAVNDIFSSFSNPATVWRAAATSVTYLTGGRQIPGQNFLVTVRSWANRILDVDRGAILNSIEGRRIEKIDDETNTKIFGEAPDRNGFMALSLPGGRYDATLQVEDKAINWYNFWVDVHKHELKVQARLSPEVVLDPESLVDGSEFVVGEPVDLRPKWVPDLPPELRASPKYKLDYSWTPDVRKPLGTMDRFVNEQFIMEYGGGVTERRTAISHRINYVLLSSNTHPSHSQNAHLWYIVGAQGSSDGNRLVDLVVRISKRESQSGSYSRSGAAIDAKGLLSVYSPRVTGLSTDVSGLEPVLGNGQINRCKIVSRWPFLLIGREIAYFVYVDTKKRGFVGLTQLVDASFQDAGAMATAGFELDGKDEFCLSPMVVLPTANLPPGRPPRAFDEYSPIGPFYDFPQSRISGSGQALEADFKDFVRYRYEGAGSIFVTLGRVDWGLKAVVDDHEELGYLVDPSSTVSGLTIVPDWSLPSWDRWVTPCWLNYLISAETPEAMEGR